jgi:Raf kinase inhibitor-like YbhB/YbcL family protein
MRLEIPSFPNGGRIPEDFVMGRFSEKAHATFAPNRNPHLKWSGTPPGAKSFALLVVDSDAPSRPDDVNREGRTVSYDLPRADFFHWVLADIPPDVSEIAAGADADGVTLCGKAPGRRPYGLAGANDYTSWFAGDKDMKGVYGGYDGPFPPWNDERIHGYAFNLYALDVSTLGLEGGFRGPAMLQALSGHVLAQASWTGTYSIYPGAR